ncbi:rare lipoprotein A [Halopseudomonas bauzanensis]|uniref:Endolytic peptidoglycan transglycosylase RlpA n=3 Tax=Pseudomonadaceae TaxID=135621 RepID=A0A1H9WTD4_9GAMM|nr:rare lipoprotein A [Halopseudomonas bauzanensis]SFM38513.1 rare lipoprotein A [Halopseudomonas bauzanensis]
MASQRSGRARPGRTGNKSVWLSQMALAALLSMSGYAAVGDSLNDEDGGLSYSAEGRASYYSSRLHGRRTASGEPYDETSMTAAHPSLPFDTQLCITNLFNGRSTAVRVNDRGPFVGSRIIDVSLAAAKELGMLRAGIARVRVETCDTLES